MGWASEDTDGFGGTGQLSGSSTDQSNTWGGNTNVKEGSGYAYTLSSDAQANVNLGSYYDDMRIACVHHTAMYGDCGPAAIKDSTNLLFCQIRDVAGTPLLRVSEIVSDSEDSLGQEEIGGGEDVGDVFMLEVVDDGASGIDASGYWDGVKICGSYNADATFYGAMIPGLYFGDKTSRALDDWEVFLDDGGAATAMPMAVHHLKTAGGL